MANSNTVVLKFVDAFGKFARMSFLVAAATVDPATLTTVRTAIAAFSACKNLAASLSFYAAYTETATTGSYADNQDKAVMKFSDEDGGHHVHKIPAPLESCFMSDKETINPADPGVDAYVTWMLANAKTKSGRDYTNFNGGKRMRLNRKNK